MHDCGVFMRGKPHQFVSRILQEMKKNGRVPDQKLIRNSFAYCLELHKNQKRLSGDYYWIHPATAALELAKLGADSETIAAELLHDIIEDTGATESELAKHFGKTISGMVEGVTKLNRISQKGREQNYEAANIQKMMLASSKDLRVLAVKLADKLHNLRTLHFKNRVDQVRIARQAILVYVPLAHKLGIHGLMHEMEDLSFSRINPKKFRQLKKKARLLQKHKCSQLKRVMQSLKKKTRGVPVSFRLLKKSVFGLYAKSNRTGKPLEELYDCCILQIETQKTLDCYRMLGVLHANFFPVPGKLKDYIAIPMPNLYQALHTTVIGPNGSPVKVYIATQKMQELERRGILAIGSQFNGLEAVPAKEKIQKLNKVFSLVHQFEESEEFMNALTKESLSKSIFVFTPKGEIVELPTGATPIDFAFKINPWLGSRIWRAKVDGKFVGVDARLESGNMVEILPSKHVQLREKWLDLANTIFAKQAIRKALQQKRFQRHPIDIMVVAKDRAGLVADASHIFQSEGISLLASYSVSQNREIGLLQFNIDPVSEEKLKEITKRLRSVRNVKQVSILK